MNIVHGHYLIIDLEATCSDCGEVPRDEMEIIEIGAVMLNARSLEIDSEFQAFIRPMRHPKLTDFCAKLTSITQAEVDAASPFPLVIDALNAWKQDFADSLFCSWGAYDRNQFAHDCAFHGVAYPFRPEHLNLKAQFIKQFDLDRRTGLSGALQILGLCFEGTHHRGIDDARNIARVVCECRRRAGS
jgi:3'-5' exoribonuclease 1